MSMNLFTQNQHRCKAFLVFRPTIGLGLWCLTPLSTIVLLYSRSVLLVEETGVLGKKPPICHKSLTNFITRLTVIQTPKVNPSYQDRSPYYKATLTKHPKVHLSLSLSFFDLRLLFIPLCYLSFCYLRFLFIPLWSLSFFDLRLLLIPLCSLSFDLRLLFIPLCSLSFFDLRLLFIPNVFYVII